MKPINMNIPTSCESNILLYGLLDDDIAPAINAAEVNKTPDKIKINPKYNFFIIFPQNIDYVNIFHYITKEINLFILI